MILIELITILETGFIYIDLVDWKTEYAGSGF
jgi:hypothetical protein